MGCHRFNVGLVGLCIPDFIYPLTKRWTYWPQAWLGVSHFASENKQQLIFYRPHDDVGAAGFLDIYPRLCPAWRSCSTVLWRRLVRTLVGYESMQSANTYSLAGPFTTTRSMPAKIAATT